MIFDIIASLKNKHSHVHLQRPNDVQTNAFRIDYPVAAFILYVNVSIIVFAAIKNNGNFPQTGNDKKRILVVTWDMLCSDVPSKKNIWNLRKEEMKYVQ